MAPLGYCGEQRLVGATKTSASGTFSKEEELISALSLNLGTHFHRTPATNTPALGAGVTEETSVSLLLDDASARLDRRWLAFLPIMKQSELACRVDSGFIG